MHRLLAGWLFIAFVWTAAQAKESISMDVGSSLSEIRVWLEENAPPLIDELNPPASAAEIAAFESSAGVILPTSVRQAYAVHNGEKSSSQGIFGTWRWLPLDQVLEHRQYLLESKLELAANAIPVLESGGGDYFFVESVESANDESDVIEWWHERPARDVRHPSFAAYLDAFNGLLKQGQFVYLPGDLVGLIDRDDL